MYLIIALLGLLGATCLVWGVAVWASFSEKKVAIR